MFQSENCKSIILGIGEDMAINDESNFIQISTAAMNAMASMRIPSVQSNAHDMNISLFGSSSLNDDDTRNNVCDSDGFYHDLDSISIVNGPAVQGINTADTSKSYQENKMQHGLQMPVSPASSSFAQPLTPQTNTSHSHTPGKDDNDDKDGERGTVVILMQTNHRSLRQSSIDSVSTTSSLTPSISCNIESSRSLQCPGHSNSTEGTLQVDSNSKLNAITDSSRFILRSGDVETNDSLVVTNSGSLDQAASSSSSASSSPAIQLHRPRPFSQQPLPVSHQYITPTAINNNISAVNDDDALFKPIRRSRSLPPSPKSFSTFEVVSMSAFDSPRAPLDQLSKHISAPRLEQELSCDWLPSQHSPPLHYGSNKDEIVTREILHDEVDSLISESVTSRPQILTSPGERPRRQSLLTPRQLQRLSQQSDKCHPCFEETAEPLWKTQLGYLGKDNFKKTIKEKGTSIKEAKNSNTKEAKNSNTKESDNTLFSMHKSSKLRRPLVPTINFQLRQTEISTDQPSVSGRLILHIPRRPGKKFHFVSLALHLRLKESIAWTRHDLFSFEVENHRWAQTVWDKKMMIPFRDRQVEEGDANAFGSRMAKGISPAAAIAAAAVAATMPSTMPDLHPISLPTGSPKSCDTYNASDSQLSINPDDPKLGDHKHNQRFGQSNYEKSNNKNKNNNMATEVPMIAMDEWRWEWLLPISKNEVRPESFEGSMGMIWYELEARCLFRWDDVDNEGNVIPGDPITISTQDFHSIKGINNAGNQHCEAAKESSGSRKLLKSFGASSKKAKSIAQAFGKLRVGNKSKNTTGLGDFNVPSLHEQYIQNSIRKTQAAAAAAANAAVVIGTDQEHTAGSMQNDDYGENIEYVQHDQDSIGTGIFLGSGKNTKDHNSVSTSAQPFTPQKTNYLPAIPEPIPFLARRTLKLYFSHPPPKISSNPSFFLPQPLMSLPTLPSTRRLKAIIPGAKVQVQIQVPSIIPIPGYTRSSELASNNKNNGGSPAKGSTIWGNTNIFGDKAISGPNSHNNNKDYHKDSRHPQNFQAALTIRKVTQHDINKNESLRRRYEFAELAASPTSRFPVSPSELPYPQGGTSGSFMRNFSSAMAMSHQSEVEEYLSLRPAIGRDNTDDIEEIVTAYPCPDEKSGDSKHYACIDAVDPLKPIQSKGWRKEIHVRKVKCEFWQKESCRIPTDDAPSRSVKIQLAPVFTYSEKEQEKEKQRHATAHFNSSVSMDPISHMAYGDSNRQPSQNSKITDSSLTEIGPSSTLSSFLKGGRHGSFSMSNNNQVESVKSWTCRKSSTGSIIASSLHLPFSQSSTLQVTPSIHAQVNRPFTLLIPIPLDNPRIRQTFSWPSAEMSSSVGSAGYENPLPRNVGAESCIDFGSELDYPSQSTLYETMGTANRGGGIGPLIATMPSGPQPKARIEVKHYLTFRLSLDMLEYEGEPEQDSANMEVHDETRTQDAVNQRELSPKLESDILTGFAHPCFISSGQDLTPISVYCENDEVPHRPLSPNTVNKSVDIGMPTECAMGSDQELCILDFERRDCKESLDNVQNVTSGNSPENSTQGVGSNSILSPSQLCSAMNSGGNVSEWMTTSQPSTNNCTRSGGLVAGAIGVLKKKASAAGLGNIVNLTPATSHGQQPHLRHSSGIAPHRVTVQKLKDFVIRVPITLVIQTDAYGKIANIHGVVDNSNHNDLADSQNNTTMRQGGYIQPTSSSPLTLSNGLTDVVTTPTMTIKNIITDSSSKSRHPIDPVESIDTNSSLISMTASVGSESLRRRLDDFATGSSSLAFAGLRR
ncbi:hypothetical protein FBU30_006643 [Linnemannia zychae]|nr:hypothetical protein FBU30_006643 [Linnemannia zychae]